ncbi:MAG: 16S rRNA (guanine(966)-N(2))-methyltransferase RsmD [Oscillospiraceae bacterium]|nr:16S rRNA (guanine(966)-N(2))-methyltransferase RsmD [Oscillospiraceae bacterium]
MRVITGSARGRKLAKPGKADLRPTSDMVKEAIFNIIQFDIDGKRVLDLFAGTGQLGIEAASRGASSVTFVDENKEAAKLIKTNLDRCCLSGKIISADSMSFLNNCGQFDLIFIDPPYEGGLAVRSVEKIFKFDILSESGIIICETGRETELLSAEAPYPAGKEYIYGKTKVTIFYGGQYGLNENSHISGKL